MHLPPFNVETFAFHNHTTTFCHCRSLEQMYLIMWPVIVKPKPELHRQKPALKITVGLCNSICNVYHVWILTACCVLCAALSSLSLPNRTRSLQPMSSQSTRSPRAPALTRWHGRLQQAVLVPAQDLPLSPWHTRPNLTPRALNKALAAYRTHRTASSQFPHLPRPRQRINQMVPRQQLQRRTARARPVDHHGSLILNLRTVSTRTKPVLWWRSTSSPSCPRQCRTAAPSYRQRSRHRRTAAGPQCAGLAIKLSEVVTWSPWAARGTPRSSPVRSVKPCWMKEVSLKSGELFTAPSAMTTDTRPTVLSAKRWSQGKLCMPWRWPTMSSVLNVLRVRIPLETRPFTWRRGSRTVRETMRRCLAPNATAVTLRLMREIASWRPWATAGTIPASCVRSAKSTWRGRRSTQRRISRCAKAMLSLPCETAIHRARRTPCIHSATYLSQMHLFWYFVNQSAATLWPLAAAMDTLIRFSLWQLSMGDTFVVLYEKKWVCLRKRCPTCSSGASSCTPQILYKLDELDLITVWLKQVICLKSHLFMSLQFVTQIQHNLQTFK